MSDPNPYQSPPEVDDAATSPPATADVVEEIAVESGRTRGVLLFAAIACGFPGGLAVVAAVLLLTPVLEERLLFALPGGVMVIFTFMCASLRGDISKLDRRRDESSVRTVVRGYGLLACYLGMTFLLMALLAGMVLIKLAGS